MSQLIAGFLASSLFKYLLHAVLLAIAGGMCGIYSERRRYFALRSVFAVAAYLVLATCFGLLLSGSVPAPCSYLVAPILSFPCFMFCFRCKLWNGFLCVAAAIAVQNLSYSSSIIFIRVSGKFADSVLGISVKAVLYIVVHIICFVVGVRKFRNIGADFEKKHIFVIIVTLVLIAVVYLLQYGKQTLETLDTAEFLEWRIMFIAFDLLILLLLFGVCDYNALRQERDILDALREGEKNRYEIDCRTIETVNLKYHDLKHQLIALRNHTDDESGRLLKELEEDVVGHDIIVKTGCRTLDIILTQKHSVCNDEGISLTCMAEGGAFSFMRVADIYSLFGNALDNAIRAELNVADTAQRYITINSSVRGGLLHIQIENYCEDRIKFKNGLPVTTRKDGANHGFGMLSIKRTVERYDGAMTVSCDENIFCLSITIPVPRKKIR